MKKSIVLLIILYLSLSEAKAFDKCVAYNNDFKFGAASCYMEVSNSNDFQETKPLFGVYKVYIVVSGNLSLPYSVK